MNKISFEIIEQMIQCFGRCFHYKDPVASFMRQSDVPNHIINKHRDLAKFVWARKVLEDLSERNDGEMIQRKLITNFCKLKDLPDKEVLDKNVGIEALNKLKRLANESNMILEEKNTQQEFRRKLAEEQQLLKIERSKKFEALKSSYMQFLTQENRQQAGLALEVIIKGLFELNEIEYKKSSKNSNGTQQIDGHFKFDSFDYLVEAKWEKGKSNSADIASLLNKVETKLSSTRGLFVSINGFRDEVVSEFSGRGSKIIFMDGADLMLILDGRVSLSDGLRLKIEKAAQIGNSYYSLNKLET